MKSKNIGNDYIILVDGERKPTVINKIITDKSLEDFKSGFEKIRNTINYLYNNGDDETYYFLVSQIFQNFQFDLTEGKNWYVNYAIDFISKFQGILNGNDDSVLNVCQLTLLDLGYESNKEHNNWVKIIECEDKEEIADEIMFLKNKTIARRKRTIIWECDGDIKTSRKISYETMEVEKDLKDICENTKTKYRIYE